MDFKLTPEQTSFRDEVRSWLKKNLPKDWSDRMRIGSDVPRPEVYDFLRKWQRQMAEAGFVGVTWPKEYGGARPHLLGGTARAGESPAPKAAARPPPERRDRARRPRRNSQCRRREA